MKTSEAAAWIFDEAKCTTAVERAREAVNAPQAVEHLVNYYNPANAYSGTTFLDLTPNHPLAIGPADLLAVTTLNVEVRSRAIRGFLQGDNVRQAAQLLAALPVDARIEDDATPELAPQMAEFYAFVKATLGDDPWVTAAKLCARKRPLLFPVRDRVVLSLLGLAERRADYSIEWPAFAAIMRDDEVRRELDNAIRDAISRGSELGDPTLVLRHLDVVLWMAGKNS